MCIRLTEFIAWSIECFVAESPIKGVTPRIFQSSVLPFLNTIMVQYFCTFPCKSLFLPQGHLLSVPRSDCDSLEDCLEQALESSEKEPVESCMSLINTCLLHQPRLQMALGTHRNQGQLWFRAAWVNWPQERWLSSNTSEDLFWNLWHHSHAAMSGCRTEVTSVRFHLKIDPRNSVWVK